MSGTVKGKIECYLNAMGPTWTYRDHGQAVFKNLYDFFSAHPNMTQIARHGGVGGTASNVNYWDQTNPFLNNAWFVFRMNTAVQNPLYLGTRTYPWYVLAQWARTDVGVFGASPGNPGLVDATTGTGSDTRVSLQFAIGIGGDQNPWKGSGSLGTNTKGTPVWGAPTGGTGSLVWPRSNNVGGAHDTNKQNTATMFIQTGAGTARCHFLADDDNFVFLYDQGAYNYSGIFFGQYVPRPELTIPYPNVMFGTGAAFVPTTRTRVYGGPLGDGYSFEGITNLGGIAGPNPLTDGVRSVMLDRYASMLETNTIFTPNKNFTIPVTDEFPISVIMAEVPSYYGWLGQVEFVREVFNIEPMARKSDGTRAVMSGSQVMNAIKWAVPWAPAANMGHGTFREGISF